MSTSASRSGAHASRTVCTARSSNCSPAWMIAARPGHGTAYSVTCGSIACTACSYAPLCTVVGVASRPMRPVRVAATAWKASGRTTPSTSTPSVVSSIRRRRLGSAAAVAELHATTSSFVRRRSSSSAISAENCASCSGERSP